LSENYVKTKRIRSGSKEEEIERQQEGQGFPPSTGGIGFKREENRRERGDEERSFRRRLGAHSSTQLFPVFPVVDHHFR
jgi:hypothetical protein